MTDIVRYQSDAPRVWIELMEPAARLAEAVARTEFVPSGLRGNVPAITAAILYGDEVGLAPMQSLAKVHVIDGRPALSAEAQRALVLAAGHEMWILESTNTKVTWCGRRAGSTETSTVTWTLDDAKKAGLDGRKNWRSYPRAMLSARASAELARAVFADAIGGLMAVEELEDPETMVGELGEPTAGEPAKSVRKARRPGKTAPAAAPAANDGRTRALGPALPGQGPDPETVRPSDGQGEAGGGEVTSTVAEPVASPPVPTPSGTAMDDAVNKQRASTVAMWCADAGFESDDDRHAFLTAYNPLWSSSYDVDQAELAGLRAVVVKFKRGELVIVDGVIVDAKSGLVPTTKGT